MKTRREIVLGGLLTMVFVGEYGCSSQAASVQHASGCMISANDAKRLLAKNTGHQIVITGAEPIIASSGDKQFDLALAQTLSRISDTLEVVPGFAFFDDGVSANAYATPLARLSNSDGTVLFGKTLLKRILTEPESPDAIVTAICAHEFGHILQYKKKLTARIEAGQKTVKRLELHADFLAGFYAGNRKLQKPTYPAAVYVSIAKKSGDYNQSAPNHHGQPDERAAAVVRGFKVAHDERRILAEAVEIGINYVATVS